MSRTSARPALLAALLCAGCVLDWDRKWDQGAAVPDVAPDRDAAQREQGPPPDKAAVDAYRDPNDWVVLLGGQKEASLNTAALDKAGNIHVGGAFSGKIVNKKGNLNAVGEDALLARLSPGGAVDLLISGTSDHNRDRVSDLFVTGGGEMYVTGSFNKTFTLGGKSVTSTNGEDVFVARLGSNGKALWITRIGDNASCVGHTVALDGLGRVWAAGSFGYQAVFGSKKLIATAGSMDAFVTRLRASDGEVRWAARAGGNNGDGAASLAVDSAGNAYVAGTFRNTADFGALSLTAGAKSNTTANVPNAFVASIKDDTFTWVTGGISAKEVRITGMERDSAGNLYVVGFFAGDVTLGKTHKMTCQGASDLFVAKLSSAGEVQWVVETSGAGFELGSAIALSPAGRVMVVGFHDGQAILGGKTFPGGGGRDVFWALLSVSGKVLAVGSGGGQGTDWGQGVALGSGGSAVITGYCQGTATLGKHTVTTASGATDAFVWKFTPGK